MKTKIILLTVFFMTVLVFMSGSVSADILLPDSIKERLTYKITNIDEYPDHIFFPESSEAVVDKDGVLDLKDVPPLMGVRLFAIDKDDLTEKEQEEIEQGNEGELNEELETNPNAVASNTRIYSMMTISKNILPIKKATVYLEVDPSGDALEITKKKVRYEYKNGETEERDCEYGDHELPQPTKKKSFASGGYSYTLMFLTGICVCCFPSLIIIVIVILLLYRRAKK